MNLIQNRLARSGGFATMIALLLVGMLTLIGLAAMNTSDTDISIAGNSLQEMRAFYAAEAGLEQAAANLQDEYTATGMPPDSMPLGSDVINSCDVSYEAVDEGPAVNDRITDGIYAGLHAQIKTYTIMSTGTSAQDHGRVVMSQSFEAAMVPIFQFAIFYEDELWASPAQDMVVKGRVHSNSDICLQASKSLRFDGAVTSAGDILHGYKYGIQSGVNGDVFFKHTSGLYQNMKQGSEWIDATHDEWYDRASSIWGGNVRDEAFGVQELNVPISNDGDPRKLIEPAAGNSDSYENKATLKFVEGVAYKKVGGAWTDVTADMTAKGIITQAANKFYDDRENKDVDVLDLDIAKLEANGYWPSNGVVYFSDTSAASSEWKAMRLTNATSLGDALTVASNNPVYTKGAFNSSGKKPAAIISDAFTVLSSNWNDANGTKSVSSRTAVPTTINASIMTGDSHLGPGSYNGGVSNLPRFLEYWGSSRTCTILGSLVNLWESKYANSTWSTSYYEPPARDYSYDFDLDDPDNMPPESPKVMMFQRSGWTQEFVGLGEDE